MENRDNNICMAVMRRKQHLSGTDGSPTTPDRRVMAHPATVTTIVFIFLRIAAACAATPSTVGGNATGISAIHPPSSSSSSSSSPSPLQLPSLAQLEYYDKVRSNNDAPPDDAHGGGVQPKTRIGSSVIEVTLPRSQQRIDGGVDGGDEEEVEDTAMEKYRLCHLAIMLPSSDGRGRPYVDFGLPLQGAAVLAVHHFNNKMDKIVPDLTLNERVRDCNVRLTLDYHDTEVSPIAANRRLINDVLSREHGLATPRPIALIGEVRSAVTSALSIMASAHLLPVISPLSKSSLLDNKDVHGLFGRVMYSNAADATAAATYFRDVHNVTHMGVLFVSDEYGISYHSDFVHAALALDPPMIVKSASFDSVRDESSIEVAVTQLAESGYRYFFGILGLPTNADSNHPVVREAGRQGLMGGGKFWLFSVNFMRLGERSIDIEDESVVRAVQGSMYMEGVLARNKQFEEAWNTMLVGTSSPMIDYFKAKQPEQLDLDSFTFLPHPTYLEYLVYDAVMAVGLAACEASEYFFNGTELFRAFKRTSFVGATTRVNIEESTGSRDPANFPFKVENAFMNDETNRSGGTVTFNVREVAVQIGGGRAWNTTNPTTYADGGHVAPPTRPSDRLITTSAWALSVGLALAGLVMLASLLWFTWTYAYRNTRVVRLSQPTFLGILCLGTFVMASSIVPLALVEPDRSQKSIIVVCMSAPWLFSIGFILCFSALFSKTAKLNKLFYNMRGLKRIRLKAKEFILPFAVLFTSTIIILILWTVIAPLKLRRVGVVSFDSHGMPVTTSYATCKADEGRSRFVFVILLCIVDMCSLAFAVYENYRARNIVTDYNERGYISLSIICILQAFALGVPVFVVAYAHPTAVFVIFALLISFTCAAVLLPVFLPKELARRKDAEQSKRMELAGQLSGSRLSRERQMWKQLKLKNDVLKNELQNVRSSIVDTSETCTESYIYYGSHNTLLQEEGRSRELPLAKSSLGGSSHGDSDESSQVQSPWVEGLDQLAF